MLGSPALATHSGGPECHAGGIAGKDVLSVATVGYCLEKRWKGLPQPDGLRDSAELLVTGRGTYPREATGF